MRDFHREDGGSTVLQNVGFLPYHYMMLQLRIPQLEPQFIMFMLVLHTKNMMLGRD